MKTIILALGIASIIFIIRNFAIIKELRISKEYTNIYHAVIAREDNLSERLCSYIEKEKDPYPSNKAKILLMFVKLRNNEDVSILIDQINFNEIFFRNNKYNVNHININSDMFVWIMAMLPRLKEKGLLDAFYDKLNKLDEKMNNHLEYKTFKAAYAFLKEDEENKKFLYELVNGEYNDLFYDKQMIGVIKRIALSYIASASQEKNNEYKDELEIFAKSYIGNCLLSDLNIFEVYYSDETK